MNTVTVPTPSPLGVKRPKIAWSNGSAQAPKPAKLTVPPPRPMQAPAPQAPAPKAEASAGATANGHDDETFTVSGGKGKSPDVEPGVYPLVVTNVRRETGPNRFEPGTEHTSYIFHLAIEGAGEEGEFLWFAGTSLKSKRLTDILTALKLSITTSFTKGQVVGRKCQGNVILSDQGYARLSQVFPAP